MEVVPRYKVLLLLILKYPIILGPVINLSVKVFVGIPPETENQLKK